MLRQNQPPEDSAGELKLAQRLQSRKFLMAAGYFVLILALGVTGQVEWEKLLFTTTGGLGAIVGIYLGVQAGIDALRSWRGW